MKRLGWLRMVCFFCLGWLTTWDLSAAEPPLKLMEQAALTSPEIRKRASVCFATARGRSVPSAIAWQSRGEPVGSDLSPIGGKFAIPHFD